MCVCVCVRARNIYIYICVEREHQHVDERGDKSTFYIIKYQVDLKLFILGLEKDKM